MAKAKRKRQSKAKATVNDPVVSDGSNDPHPIKTVVIKRRKGKGKEKEKDSSSTPAPPPAHEYEYEDIGTMRDPAADALLHFKMPHGVKRTRVIKKTRSSGPAQCLGQFTAEIEFDDDDSKKRRAVITGDFELFSLRERLAKLEREIPSKHVEMKLMHCKYTRQLAEVEVLRSLASILETLGSCQPLNSIKSLQMSRPQMEMEK